MRGRQRVWYGMVVAATLVAPPSLAQQQAPRDAPPERIGPTWGGRQHPPTPAEVEERSRARGLPAPRQDREAQDVDRLFRDLTGRDPQAPPRSGAREVDRR